MAMQSQLWSISALSTELHMDRRTLAKRLEGLIPAESKQVGKRTENRWRLSDVITHLNQPRQASQHNLDAERMARVQAFVCKHLYPSLTDSNAFIGAMLANTIDGMGLTKPQALEIYKTTCVAICAGLSEIFEDDDIKIDTAPFFDLVIECGNDKFIENHWPEWE